MSLTPESKSKLSTTIRSLRAGLLRDLEDHVMGVYRLAVPIGQAGLAEADTVRRGRLEAWLDERTRGAGGKDARSRFLKQAVKEAAATLVNRLVFLRLLEQTRGPDDRPLRRTQIVSGGWSSKAYLEFRDYAGALLQDESEGYGTLLELVFDDLAVDLPGLYGSVGVTDLIPVPTASLRMVIEALNHRDLDGAWDDDTTLGWVYQYWNDPEREALDDKIKGGGKIEPHEIAAKTQMFTERYMVEWLLHNSLGPTWFAICRRHGWRADVEDVLPGLEARRAEWRAKREAGEVALDALMPILSPLEERWKYYVLQDIPKEAVAAAPDSLRDLKLLDPACGSGHFPVIACGLLFELYREEARHRGEDGTEVWSDRAIVAHILEDNLHGIDIDPRAVQIAAAALWLKARTLAGGVRPRRLNLVAPAFNLSGLPDDDPALKTLLHEVWRETGLPEDLTRGIVRALAGADHLGTLLKVDRAVAEAVLSHQIATGAFEREPDLFKHWDYRVKTANTTPDPTAQGSGPQMDTDKHRYPRSSVSICGQNKNDVPGALILDKLEAFLARHTAGSDLGLRLDGEQLAAGVRFIRMVQDGMYHIVVGNPPYQGTARMTQPDYLRRFYPQGKADLYAAFMMRSLDLARDGGMFALLTMRGWMFVNQFTAFRAYLFSKSSVVGIGDVDRGAFAEVFGSILAVSMTIARKGLASLATSYVVQPTPLGDVSSDRNRTARKRAAVLVQRGVYKFSADKIRSVPGAPVIYWWPDDLVLAYSASPKLEDHSAVRTGLCTSDNVRFLRKAWEIGRWSHTIDG
jgi:hypothetical protein